jgi:spermidine synthase
MDRDQTLHRIEQAGNDEEILAALRDYLSDPANGHDPRLATMLGDTTDVPSIALELTRFRLAARTTEAGTPDLEAVFARASVRLAELMDHTGGWQAFRLRSKNKTPGEKQ